MAETAGVAGVVPVARPARGVQPIEAVAGPDPKRAPLVLIQSADAIVPQAVGVAGSVTVNSEGFIERVEAVETAVVGADPEDAVPVHFHGEDAVIAEAGIARALAPGFETAAVVAVEAAAEGAQPKIALFVFSNGGYFIVAEAMWLARVGLEPFEADVTVEATNHFVETTAVGTDPDHALPVFMAGENPVVTQAFGQVWIVAIGRECFVRFIEAVEPAAVRPDPEHALLVFQQGADVMSAQAARILVVLENLETIAVETVQTVLGTHPEETPVVLEDAEGGDLGKALFQGEGLEAGLSRLAKEVT